MTARARLNRLALGVPLLALGLFLAVTTPVYTDPFREGGDPISESIADMEKHLIGGMPQMLWFRGLSTDNPALIILHGGPGASEAALFRHYNAALEERFLVVHWEQRGTGRSYSRMIPPDSMTIEQFVRDLHEVVELVKRRFDKDNVILLGHSWGTVLGVRYAHEHPRNVAAYVGVAQIANMPLGERLSHEFALARAKEHGNQRALRELERIGPPPHTVGEMLTSRRWVARFGGSFHAELSTGALIRSALQTSETSWLDLVLFGLGNRFSLEHLWPELRRIELDRDSLNFEVPVFFLLGRFDWQVPAVAAEAYFHELSAPYKQLVWFEGSAHHPPFEEPEAFNRVLLEEVLPLVLGDP